MDNALYGMLIGAGAASLLDMLFAYDDRGPAPAPPKRTARGVSMAPSLAIGRGDAVAGVVGRF